MGIDFTPIIQASLVAQLVKNPPTMQENWVLSLGWKHFLEKGKAIHSSILAWRIPWTVQSMRVTKSRTQQSNFHFHFHPFLHFSLVVGKFLSSGHRYYSIFLSND